MAEPIVAIVSACQPEPLHHALAEGIDAFFAQTGAYKVVRLSPDGLQTIRADGCISLGPIHADQAIKPDHVRILRAEVPLLTLVQHNSREVPSVSFNLEAMLQRAIADLVERCGRRQIALLSHTHSPFSYKAKGAFQRAMLRHDLLVAPEWLIHARPNANSVEGALGAFLEAGGALDALLTTSTAAALVAMRTFKTHHLRVPRDVSVIGFEDSPAAQQVGLTTFAIDWQMLGYRAARQLHAQWRYGPLVGQTLIDAPLIQRSTC